MSLFLTETSLEPWREYSTFAGVKGLNWVPQEKDMLMP